MKARANIDHAGTIRLIAFINASVLRETYKEIKALGWKLYMVKQQRGRCYYHIKTITIPDWVFRIEAKKPGYSIWYIAHEMAHVKAGLQAHHGPMFMLWLKAICPQEYQQYELGYKARNAASMGITKQAINGALEHDTSALDWEAE